MSSRLRALVVCAALGLLGMDCAVAADKAASAPSAKLVDINSASKEELKTLPGIGDAEAQRIINARPYPSKAKLAVDKVISDPLYAGLQGKIVAAQPPPGKAKSDTKSPARP